MTETIRPEPDWSILGGRSLGIFGVLGVGDEDMKIRRVSLGGLVPTSIDRPS